MLRKVILIIVLISLITASSWAKQVKPVYKWGFIDKTGKMAIPARYDQVSDFHEGLAAVKVVSSWGYINKNGKAAVSPRFTTANDFSEGLAAVSIKEKHGFINKQGKFAIEPVYQYAFDFHQGLAPVKINGKWGFIDKKGAFVIKPKFDSVDALGFSENIASVSVGDKVTIIDKGGNILMKPIFGFIGPFSEGLAPIIENLKCGFIDTAGKKIIKSKYRYAGPFSEGLSVVSDANYRDKVIDHHGRIVFNLEDDLSWDNNHFSEGLISVHNVVKHRSAFMDRNGNTVTSFNFDMITGSFQEGLAAVSVGGSMKSTGKDGSSIWVNGKWGYIDKTGKFVIKPTFIYPDGLVPRGFSEGLASVPVRVSK